MRGLGVFTSNFDGRENIMFKKSIMFLIFIGVAGSCVHASQGGPKEPVGKKKQTQAGRDKKMDDLTNIVASLARKMDGQGPSSPWGGWGNRELTGKEHVKKICTDSVHRILCGENSATLKKSFDDGFMNRICLTIG